MKIYLVATLTQDYHTDSFNEIRILKAFDTYNKAENFINEFISGFKNSIYEDRFIETDDDCETGKEVDIWNDFTNEPDKYTLLRHFEEKEECWYDDVASSVELLIREMDLN